MDSAKFDPAVLAQLPSLQPPPGVQPNFINPESIAHQTRDATYVALPLMLSFLTLRVYTRLRITHSFGADDCKSSLRRK
jgi:hypothetical protein